MKLNKGNVMILEEVDGLLSSLCPSLRHCLPLVNREIQERAPARQCTMSWLGPLLRVRPDPGGSGWPSPQAAGFQGSQEERG